MCKIYECVQAGRITNFCFFSECQLVNGDVTFNYRHPGYQKMKHFSRVDRTVSVESKESRWISEIMEVINEVVSSLYISNCCIWQQYLILLPVLCWFLSDPGGMRSNVISGSVGLSVCLSVSLHISEAACPYFTNFSVYITCGRGSILLWWQCNK